MTLTSNQGHRKWYEWVKLNEYYHRTKFDIYHICSVREDRRVQVFVTYRLAAVRPNTDHYIGPHFSCESKPKLSSQLELLHKLNWGVRRGEGGHADTKYQPSGHFMKQSFSVKPPSTLTLLTSSSLSPLFPPKPRSSLDHTEVANRKRGNSLQTGSIWR